jgi:outer membrane protein assembly factor BamD (BamD/ComL family)
MNLNKNLYRISSIFLLSLTFMSLQSCKTLKLDEDTVTPANELYSKATGYFESDQYQKAADEYENLYFQHPGKKITA